jgi:hypothetical protein
MSYDVIVPKANKANEFAPLIEIAERELENFEEEEGNGMTEEEFKKFTADIYYQALVDIVSGGSLSEDEGEGESSDNYSKRDQNL